MSKTKAELEADLATVEKRAAEAEAAKEAAEAEAADLKEQLAEAHRGKEAAEAEAAGLRTDLGDVSVKLEAYIEAEADQVESVNVEGYEALTNVRHDGKRYKTGQTIPLDALPSDAAERLLASSAIIPVAGD